MQKTISDAEKVINKSGNAFQSKVVKYFREKEWEVVISPYYNDNVTDKPREIDIIATKKFPVNIFFNKNIGDVRARLFIECKYITNTSVFWFDGIDKPNAINRTMKDTGLESPKVNISIENHHYLNTLEVAKIFASDHNNQNEIDIFYKAINQCLNANLYYKNKSTEARIAEHRPILKTLNYPIVICDKFDNLFKTNFDNSSPIGIDKNFVVEINYAYLNAQKENVNEYFLIDVVNYNKLDEFLELIESSDINKVVENQSQRGNVNGFEQMKRGTFDPYDY